MGEKKTCLIVDDEPIARDIIKSYCMQYPLLDLAGECGNAIEAKRLLSQQRIDVLFLDIHLPVLDGINFLKTLKDIPAIIFTTAYREYAANAFDLDACDYLVKPFSLERFIVAVDKAIDRLDREMPGSVSPVTESHSDQLFIKINGKIVSLVVSDILYAEAKGNFTRVVLGDKVVLPSISFSAFMATLPGHIFVQVHRSFIVNRYKITHIQGNIACVGKDEIPIGSNYKDAFFRFIGI